MVQRVQQRQGWWLHWAALAAAYVFWGAFCPASAAPPRWIEIKTSHFEMYTTNSARQGAAALAAFEQVRSFFLQASPSKNAPDQPVRIVAFKSEKEFFPYRPNGGAIAYYQRSRKRDYIVMQDISADHYQTAVHEYTHLIVQHAGLTLPIWLNEGMADLYSSLEATGDRTMVGRPLLNRSQVLASAKWIKLDALTSAGPDSPYYNDPDKMPVFYAQSWLLTHMLALSEGYSPKFTQFTSSVSSGKGSAESFTSVYGKTLTEVARDLDHYFHQSTMRASIFNVKLNKAGINPVVRDLPPLETDLALADLLATHRATAAEALGRLRQLAAANPDSPDVQESLGYLAWEQGDEIEARARFRNAFAQGSTDADMLYHYASLAGPSEPAASMAALQKAIQLKPDFDDARFAFGLEQMSAKQYAGAYSTFSEIKHVKSDQAFTIFSGLAYSSLQLKSPKQAREWENKAFSYARTASERTQASGFLAYLDEQSKPSNTTQVRAAPVSEVRPTVLSARQPPAHVKGTAERFECTANKFRLHVRVQAEDMVFSIDDPKDVIVRNKEDGHVDFACGVMKPTAIEVFYVPATQQESFAGHVRELAF